ncbi:MAG: hypothetical protein PHG82_03725 [Candidatus Gracilibacteria bacterium]|nr:hypothetical protein [Candidatus Gracilibacteria bacterium]
MSESKNWMADYMPHNTSEEVKTPEVKKDFKATFNDAISDGKITKEELTNVMDKFEGEKNNIGANTKEELNSLKKEAITNMLTNGFDIRDSKDISNLTKFIEGTDFKLDKTLETKLSTIKAFFDKADKSMLEKARDFVGYDNLTLTLSKDGKQIVEMGILDLNNPLNDNLAEIKKENYDLDKAISGDAEKKLADAKIKKEAEEAEAAEKAKKASENVVPTQNVEVVKPIEKPKLVDKLGDATGNGNKQDEKYTKSFLEKNFDKLNSLILKNEGIKNSLLTVLKDPNEANVQALQKTLGVKSDGAFGKKTLDALSAQV